MPFEIARRLGRLWRVFATGLCFAVFGIGGLLVYGLVLPLAWLLVPAGHRERFGKQLVRLCFQGFVGLLVGTGTFRLRIEGREKLQRRGLLVLANHPTLIDIVLLLALTPHADVVVKAAAWRNPFMGGPLRMANYIRNDAGPELVDACAAALARGNNLILFPEGTRTVPGQPLHFQRGAAHIAIRGQGAVTPVIMRTSVPWLTKRSVWYRPPREQPRLVVSVLDDVTIAPLIAGREDAGAQARALTAALENLFRQEGSPGG